jgi:hypothetical protein
MGAGKGALPWPGPCCSPSLICIPGLNAQSMKVGDARERVPIANKARALNLFFDIECLETITGMAGEMAPQLPPDTVLAVARLTPSAHCLTTRRVYWGPTVWVGLVGWGLAGEVNVRYGTQRGSRTPCSSCATRSSRAPTTRSATPSSVLSMPMPGMRHMCTWPVDK